MNRCLTAAIVAVVLALAHASTASAAQLFTAGHADLQVTYEAGDFSLQYYLGVDAVLDGVPDTLPVRTQFAPNALINVIPDLSVPRPAGAAWDFTGTAAGSPLWYIGQTQQPDRPWLGISTESLNPADFTGNVTYALTGISGPGHLSLTTTGVFGGNTIYFQTSDGISGADVINVSSQLPTHAHYNWYFTEKGVYTVDLTVSATLAGGGPVSDSGSFKFFVGVPEPSSMVLSTAAVMAIVCARRRRRGNAVSRTRSLATASSRPALAKTAPFASAMIAMFTALTSETGAQAQAIYTSGHADISVSYEAGSGVFDMHHRLGEGAAFEDGTELLEETLLPADAVVTRVPDPPFIVSDNPFWSFIDVPVGSPVWINPQIQENGKPYHGFATEELVSSDWVGGRDAIVWSLDAFSGPAGGQFTLYSEGAFGDATVIVDTADGITAEDDFSIIFGHAHYNWLFTKTGVYQLEFTAAGTHVVDGPVSGSGAFTFYVGNVPEPSSGMLLCAALGGLVGIVRRGGTPALVLAS